MLTSLELLKPQLLQSSCDCPRQCLLFSSEFLSTSEVAPVTQAPAKSSRTEYVHTHLTASKSEQPCLFGWRKTWNGYREWTHWGSSSLVMEMAIVGQGQDPD